MSQGWLVEQLPLGMTQEEFFVRFVSIFQEVADTFVEGIDTVPSVIDLTVAPPSFVHWLGTWIGLDVADSAESTELQRAWVRRYGLTLARRGTAQGLRLLLEQLTSGSVEILDGGGVYCAGEEFHRQRGGTARAPRGSAVSAGPPRPAGPADMAPAGSPQEDAAWVRVSVRGAARIPETELVRIILDEVPAHVTVEISVGGRLIFPRPEEMNGR